MSDSLTTLLSTVVVLVVIFMICRAVMLWYWKVDEQVALLKEIRDSLRRPAASPLARTQSSAALTEREREAAVEAEIQRIQAVRNSR